MLRTRYWRLLAAATLALAGGAAGMTTAGTAHAATPSCGSACIDIFNDQFGDGITGHPAFLVDSFKQGAAVGTPIILFRESNNDPAEDFVVEDQDTVNNFFQVGMVSAAVALHYGCVEGGGFTTCPSNTANLEAYEFEYAPYGASTGNCIGLAATATQNEHVTLQPCGVSSKTLWIVDEIDGSGAGEPFGDSGAFSEDMEDGVPLINGSDNNFSHPYVLTYPQNGYPTDLPRPILTVTNLSGHFTGIFPTNSTINADVDSNQLWDALTGPIQI